MLSDNTLQLILKLILHKHQYCSTNQMIFLNPNQICVHYQVKYNLTLASIVYLPRHLASC